MNAGELPQLYLIADSAGTERPLLEALGEALDAGVRLIQLRERSLPDADYLRLAEAIVQRAEPYRALVLLNGRPHLVDAAGAHGVHLRDGQPLRPARELLGPGRCLGVSAHRVERLPSLKAEGANLATFSPIFPTPSKPGSPGVGIEGLRAASRRSSVPIYALGGVTPARVASCLRAGAFGVAVLRGVLAAPSICEAVSAYLRRLAEYP